MSTKELPGDFFIFFFFLAPSIVPITIELPERVSQTKFNLESWAEIWRIQTRQTPKSH